MQAQIFPDPESLGHHVARKLLAGIEQARTARRRFLLGCPSGRTPKPVYNAMAAILRDKPQDISNLVLVMMDEYVVPGAEGRPTNAPIDAHFSCHRFAEVEIADALDAALPPLFRLRQDNIWFPDPAEPHLYDQRIADAGGIDYFILASGAGDGHVAFNPPGSPVDGGSRVITLAEQTRRDNLKTFPAFRDLSEVPLQGVSVGVGTIAKARAAGMLLTGAGKREAFKRITAASTYDPQWPATVIHLVPEAEILADRAAAG
jgi:glucosamine-6-phosphate deaminase